MLDDLVEVRRPWQLLDKAELGGRASKTLSESPRPFLRWAGSKQRLLRQLVPLLPEAFDRYFEPFLGSGALFFLLRPRRAYLSDICDELVQTYQAVRRAPEEVLRRLGRLNPLDKDQYYSVRAHRSVDEVGRAAEFIYLNKAGWNGLYRVNSRGEFNVPYGAPRSGNVIDAGNLRACAQLLHKSRSQVRKLDFASAVRNCRTGDFVFFDPPYVTGHNNNGFVDYNEQLFSWPDQVRLAKVARSLAQKGVQVMVTNAHHDAVLALYDGFDIVPIERSSTLAGDSRARRTVTEAVIRSYR